MKKKDEWLMNVTSAILVMSIVIILWAGLSAIFAVPVMFIWNKVVTEMFSISIIGSNGITWKLAIPNIGFWAAFWFNILCSILFKSVNLNKSKD